MNDSSAQDPRLAEIERWIARDLGFGSAPLVPASSDASFRRYFRVPHGGESCIVMDAPPAKEDVRPFLRVAALLAEWGLNVPRVLACDVDRGWVLLTDLGSRQYLPELADPLRAPALYADALGALLRMQVAGRAPAAEGLPCYDRDALLREMALFPQWFLGTHLGLDIDGPTRAMLDRLFDTLVGNALEQPTTFVHRDYHSRNLMVAAVDNPGILDFQDAVQGPVTYDLVSLLKDCYVVLPRERVRDWALAHRDRLRAEGFPVPADDAAFLRAFDLMGLQRHLKVLGIFCRLHYRDAKAQYLRDLPRVLAYVREVADAYPETADFAEFLGARVANAFDAAQRRAIG
jgi:aminoglycoside/choline kinase family phosphotransferase